VKTLPDECILNIRLHFKYINGFTDIGEASLQFQ